MTAFRGHDILCGGVQGASRLGTAIISATWHALLGLVIISAAYFRKIRLEELRLGEVFGADYDTYRHEVRA